MATNKKTTTTNKKTTSTPKADPNAVTWNPDGSYNKGGKTYRKQTMSNVDYMNYLRQRAQSGQQLSPQEKQYLDASMRNYYSHNYQGGKSGAGDQRPAPTYAQYDIEIPNYKGSVAATPAATTPTTTKKTTTTTPATDPRADAITAANAKGATELARLLKNKGISNDTYGITEDFNRLLAEAAGTVPTGKDFNSANIGTYFNYEDMFNKAWNTSTDRGRNTAQQQLNQLTPEGWTYNYFQDTADDPILQAILGQQYGETQSNLQRQLERGQISQNAYDYALQQMGANDPNAYTGLAAKAYQELQGSGGNVLGSYRTGLGDIEKGFQSGVTNYSIGQDLNPGGNYWQSELDKAAQGYRSGMEGDIRRAIGNTTYFDPYSLVSKAGSVTGPSNNPLTGNVAQGQGSVLQQDDQQRTTGTSGVF